MKRKYTRDKNCKYPVYRCNVTITLRLTEAEIAVLETAHGVHAELDGLLADVAASHIDYLRKTLALQEVL